MTRHDPDRPQGTVQPGTVDGRRVALVTGGSRGIGYAIAARLLADGFAVCITARKPDGLEDAAARLGNPDRVHTFAGKSDDPEHRRQAVDEILERFGSLDVLVNNAGINPVYAELLDVEETAATKILTVNLLSALGWSAEMRRARRQTLASATRRADRAGQGQGQGSIVNVSSFATVRPSPGLGVYGASKAALRHATRQLALELAPDIRVNAVVPAVIATDFAGKLYEGRETEVAAEYPLQRIGRPDDVAAAVAFLASHDASWITGQSLLIDGGLSVTGGIA